MGVQMGRAEGRRMRRAAACSAALIIGRRPCSPPPPAKLLPPVGHRKLSGAYLACMKLRARVPARRLFYDAYDSHAWGPEAEGPEGASADAAHRVAATA